MKEPIPYLFLGSPPIGPNALRVLKRNNYLPAAVVTDTKMSTEELIALVEEKKIGLILVVGFGALLKQDLLDSVAGQVINIHPSFLPAYRGPAPVVQTILDGVSETGITVIEIDSKMDHGPILAQEKQALNGHETPDELYTVLIEKGVRLFLDNIDAYLAEELDLLPQEHDEATFTHFIKKDDGLLDLSEPAEVLERKVRAFQGWPGTWVMYKGKRLIVHTVFLQGGELRFADVQPEGGKRMPVKAFLAGQRVSEEEFYSEFSTS